MVVFRERLRAARRRGGEDRACVPDVRDRERERAGTVVWQRVRHVERVQERDGADGPALAIGLVREDGDVGLEFKRIVRRRVVWLEIS